MRILFFVVLLVSLASCKGKRHWPATPPPNTDSIVAPLPPNDSTTKANIFPLNANNYWVYNTQHFSTEGKEEVNDFDTMRISRFKEFNGKTYAYVNPFWLRNEDYNTIAGYDSIINTETSIKNTVTSDSMLLTYKPISSTPDCRYGLKVYQNKTRTTIKNMNCYKVTYINTNCKGYPYAIINIYISEGVGIVQTEYYTFDNDYKKYLHTRQVLTTSHIEP